MLVPIGSNNSMVCRRESMDIFRGMKDLPTEEYSPEKAGVGGSIPSLATMFSITYDHLSSTGCPIVSQFRFQFTRFPSFSTALSCDSGRSCS
jgi:hypothetical protein